MQSDFMPTDVLPRSVPSDPESARNEREVREEVARLTRATEELHSVNRIGPGPCVKGSPFDDPAILGFPSMFGEVNRMALKPGDVLILHSDVKLSASVVSRLRRQFREQFPEHKLVILEKGLRLTVASEEPA